MGMMTAAIQQCLKIVSTCTHRVLKTLSLWEKTKTNNISMGFILFVGDGEAEKMDLCRGYDGCTPDAAANHISSVVGVLLQAPSFHQSSNKFEVVGYLFWKKGSRVWHLGLNHAVSAPHTNIFILVDSLLIHSIQPTWESSRLRAKVQSET